VRLKEAIVRAGGLNYAADIVEKVVYTGQPILSNQIKY